MLARLDAVPRNGKLNGGSEAAKPKFNRRKLDSLLGFQLRLAYITISRHFAVALSQVNLTQKQTGALWLIGSNAGVSQIELAKELGIDRASMMVIIDRLEERRLIARERTPRDGRLKALFLTTKGRKTLSQCKTAIARHERWLAERFSKGQLRELMQSLRRIRD
jgi:DNA-binding MarR family transcriptional regulator